MQPVFNPDSGLPLFLESGLPALAEDPCECCDEVVYECFRCDGTVPASVNVTISGVASYPANRYHVNLDRGWAIGGSVDYSGSYQLMGTWLTGGEECKWQGLFEIEDIVDGNTDATLMMLLTVQIQFDFINGTHSRVSANFFFRNNNEEECPVSGGFAANFAVGIDTKATGWPENTYHLQVEPTDFPDCLEGFAVWEQDSTLEIAGNWSLTGPSSEDCAELLDFSGIPPLLVPIVEGNKKVFGIYAAATLEDCTDDLDAATYVESSYCGTTIGFHDQITATVLCGHEVWKGSDVTNLNVSVSG